MSLDALKALKDRLKKETKTVAGERRFVKKSELEEAKLAKLREEEAAEREEKERKRKHYDASTSGQPAQKAARQEEPKQVEEVDVPKEEVIRRLRALRQPATLFGEEDSDRLKRLHKAEQELDVGDEVLDEGQPGNLLLELQRKQEQHRKQERPKGDADKSKADREKEKVEQLALVAAAGLPPEDPTLAAFKRAAAVLAEKRQEDKMSTEQRIGKYIKRWMAEWEVDLEGRSEEVKASRTGRQATVMHQQTMKYFEPLHERLRTRNVPEELLVGVWMMIQAMLQRNYLQANDIYLKLAVGNTPWPIGVTSVGIHERSAREKISHVMNVSGQAHIMNDEATRKYLQAIKRLITFLQRAYPTDPSRSIDFTSAAEPGRGSTGRGSDKLALLEAEATHTDWRSLGLADAPHFIEDDGSVKVPDKWANVLARATAKEASMRDGGH